MPNFTCSDCGQEFEGTGKVCSLCVRARILKVPRAELAKQDAPVGYRESIEKVRRVFAEDIPASVLIAVVVGIAAITFLVSAGFGRLSSGSFRLPPGMVAPDDPVQEPLTEPKSWDAFGLRFEALARYRLKARVLFKVRMTLDAVGDLAPYDLSVGWGKMSDTKNLRRVRFFHAGRFLGWNSDDRDLEPRSLGIHLANMHIIPASDRVASVIRKVDTDSIVELKGFLVNVSGQGLYLTTSLTRDDEGPGACEVMWVEDAKEL